MEFVEMNDQELQSIDGGILETLALIWVVYEVSYAVGKAIAHATNK